MDRLTKEQRSKCMSAIRGTNTKPEILVRKFLFSQGFRYRINDSRLPGHPDIVLPKYKTVIFINGCFWHGHEGCSKYSIPKTNTDFWTKKIERNKKRDSAVQYDLMMLGWHIIVVWQCELKPNVRQQTFDLLINKIKNFSADD